MEKFIYELVLILKRTCIPEHKIIFGHTLIVGQIILEQTICVCLIFLYNLNIKDARRAVPCNPEY